MPTPISVSKPNHPFAAFWWVTLSMICLAAIAVLVRYCTKQGYDPFQLLFLRTAFSVLLMLPLLYVRGASLMASDQLKLYWIRILLSFLSMASMFHALELITVGEVTAIGFLSPIFGTLFAILILGEQVHFRRWAALAVGLIGALIMLRPGLVTFGLGQALALTAAMAIGVIGPLVKKLTRRDDPNRIVFITNLGMLPVSLVPALYVWQTPSGDVWLATLALAFLSVVGHSALVRGYAATDASLVMTYKFSRLPFAVLLGYLAFGEVIDGPVWIGASIIFAAAVYIARREARLAKDKAASRNIDPAASTG